MMRTILGFFCGLYVGTTYDVKPIMKELIQCVNEKFPPKS